MSLWFYPPLIALSAAFYGGLALVGALAIGQAIEEYRWRRSKGKPWARR